MLDHGITYLDTGHVQSPCGSARRRLIGRVRVLYAISLQACSVALDHGSHVILCSDASSLTFKSLRAPYPKIREAETLRLLAYLAHVWTTGSKMMHMSHAKAEGRWRRIGPIDEAQHAGRTIALQRLPAIFQRRLSRHNDV
jgi:hypothetical protein